MLTSFPCHMVLLLGRTPKGQGSQLYMFERFSFHDSKNRALELQDGIILKPHG